MPTERCKNCGTEIEYESILDLTRNGWRVFENNDWYCPDCIKECENCNCIKPSSEMIYIESTDQYICQECADEHCRQCDKCNTIKWKEDLTAVEGINGNIIYVCEACKNEMLENEQIRWSYSRQEYIEINNENNNTMPQTHLHPEIWRDINNCINCNDSTEKCSQCLEKMAKEKKAEETTLWVYDNRPQSYHIYTHNQFKSLKLREPHEHPYLFYGIENEVLFNSSTDINIITKEYIDATNGLFVAEYDRSVSNEGNGIEFISRPLSYKMWKSEQVYQALEAGKKVLEKYNACNPQPTTCGLHVHMSLPFFEHNTKKKVSEIKSDLDWMFQIYQPEIEALSRRAYTKYCTSKAYRIKKTMSYARRTELGFNLNPTISISKGNITMSQGSGATHHDAIIQTQKTIEIRTFKSTIDTDQLLATIELCRCLAHAARNIKLTKNNTLGDIIWCKDSKYLPEIVRKTKIDTTKKFTNKLEVKL